MSDDNREPWQGVSRAHIESETVFERMVGMDEPELRRRIARLQHVSRSASDNGRAMCAEAIRAIERELKARRGSQA